MSGITDIWTAVQAKVETAGFSPAGVGPASPRSYRMQARRVEGDNALRGGIGNGLLRMVWDLNVELTWADARDPRAELDAAVEVEELARSTYGASTPTTFVFQGAEIVVGDGRIVATLRFRYWTSRS